MKALTVWEPWATLLAAGVKRFETRSWGTNYRGKILIHAARRWTREQEDLCRREGVIGDHWRQIAHEDIYGGFAHRLKGEPPYLGCIVGVGILTDCIRLDESYISITRRMEWGEDELKMGNWRPERFAWRFNDVSQIHPLVIKGQQGLWTLPDHTSGTASLETLPHWQPG